MRHLWLVLALFGLAGCGFTPLHGKTDDLTIEVGTYLASTKPVFRQGPGAIGQQLQNELEDRFNPNSSRSLYGESFRLEFALREERTIGVIDRNAAISRYDVTLVSQYRLIDAETREVLDSGTLRRSTAFYNAPEKYAAYIAERDAKERIIKEISEDYALRLSAYFARAYKLGQRSGQS